MPDEIGSDAAKTHLPALLERMAHGEQLALAIEADDETSSRAFTQIIDLARDKRLSAYDAAYVELAMRLGVPLASKDRRLCRAADGLGIAVVNAG
jgi:predicted nucleic acid-binding protein